MTYDYHADYSHVSASMLKVLMASPESYYRQFIRRDMEVDKTDAMEFGSMFHTSVLEPEAFEDTYVVMPDFHLDPQNTTGKGERSESKATSYYKAKVAEWIQENKGKQFVSQDDINLTSRMFRACHRHKELSYLLHAEGDTEKPILWRDMINRKCRPDKVIHANGVILDLKTCDDSNPLAFASKAAKLAYYIQAAWYRQAIEASIGETYRFLFAAISKKEPHEVGLYELEDSMLDFANSKCEQLVSELVERTEKNNWLAAWQQSVVTLPLPRWVESSFYEVSE